MTSSSSSMSSLLSSSTAGGIATCVLGADGGGGVAARTGDAVELSWVNASSDDWSDRGQPRMLHTSSSEHSWRARKPARGWEKARVMASSRQLVGKSTCRGSCTASPRSSSRVLVDVTSNCCVFVDVTSNCRVRFTFGLLPTAAAHDPAVFRIAFAMCCGARAWLSPRARLSARRGAAGVTVP